MLSPSSRLNSGRVVTCGLSQTGLQDILGHAMVTVASQVPGAPAHSSPPFLTLALCPSGRVITGLAVAGAAAPPWCEESGRAGTPCALRWLCPGASPLRPDLPAGTGPGDGREGHPSVGKRAGGRWGRAKATVSLGPSNRCTWAWRAPLPQAPGPGLPSGGCRGSRLGAAPPTLCGFGICGNSPSIVPAPVAA